MNELNALKIALDQNQSLTAIGLNVSNHSHDSQYIKSEVGKQI